MGWLSSFIMTISVMAIISAVFDVLAPDGNMQKPVRMVISLAFLLTTVEGLFSLLYG